MVDMVKFSVRGCLINILRKEVGHVLINVIVPVYTHSLQTGLSMVIRQNPACDVTDIMERVILKPKDRFCEWSDTLKLLKFKFNLKVHSAYYLLSLLLCEPHVFCRCSSIWILRKPESQRLL